MYKCNPVLCITINNSGFLFAHCYVIDIFVTAAWGNYFDCGLGLIKILAEWTFFLFVVLRQAFNESTSS